MTTVARSLAAPVARCTSGWRGVLDGSRLSLLPTLSLIARPASDRCVLVGCHCVPSRRCPPIGDFPQTLHGERSMVARVMESRLDLLSGTLRESPGKIVSLSGHGCELMPASGTPNSEEISRGLQTAMVIMEPAPPRSLRPNQRRADSGSLSVTQDDTQTLALLCMRAPFTPARSSAAAATSTGPARSVAARDAQPPGPNDVEPAGRRPCRRVRRLVVAEQRSQLQPPDVVLSLLRVSWVQKCAPSSHRRARYSEPSTRGTSASGCLLRAGVEMQKPKAPSKKVQVDELPLLAAGSLTDRRGNSFSWAGEECDGGGFRLSVSLLDSRSSPPALPSWRGAPTSLAEVGAACAHPLLLSDCPCLPCCLLRALAAARRQSFSCSVCAGRADADERTAGPGR